MLPADACALAQEFTPPALVPAPRRADLGSDGFIAAAISPSAPAFPSSPNPLSRSIPGRRTQADCLLECAGSDASVTWCVFALEPWGHLHALPLALFPFGTLGLGESPALGGAGGQGPETGSEPIDAAHLDARGEAISPVQASPPACEVQPRGFESATPRAASASDLRSKCFPVGEDVHDSVSFLTFRFRLLPPQRVKHACTHTRAHTYTHTSI